MHALFAIVATVVAKAAVQVVTASEGQVWA